MAAPQRGAPPLTERELRTGRTAKKELSMERQAFLSELQQRIAEMVRSSPAADLERNLKAMLGQTFQRLELVSREEFDIQVELLNRLRRRVETLEAQMGPEDTSKH